MPIYKKKPVEVEAIRFDAEKWIYERKSVYPMVETKDCYTGQSSLGKYFRYEPVINTLEGDMKVSHGDYIIKGVQGEYYPCKPDIFEQTYDLIPSKPYYDIIGNRVEVLLDGVWQKATIVNGYRTHDGIINAKRDNGEGFGCGAARHDEFVRPIEGETKYEE